MSTEPVPGLFNDAVVERQPRLSDQVADRMLDIIVTRGLTPGDRLPSERELGDQFGVSRTVIREAVRALVAKGVVDVVTGSGLRISAANPSNVRESMSLFLRNSAFDYGKMHEVRKMFEMQIAGLAAERSTASDLERLAEIHTAMEAVIDEADVERAASYDLEFHRAIARATQNELFLILMDAIGEALLEVRRANLEVNGKQTIQQHRRILEAIVARDVDGALGAMSDHLVHAEETWRHLHVKRLLPTPAS
jgi:GntR family transcriptional repressor for pyruvate dehydrogenase complex